METYVALYRGHVLERAKPVAVAVDPETIELVARRILSIEQQASQGEEDSVGDALRRGRRAALRAVIKEARRFRVLLGKTATQRVGSRPGQEDSTP